MIVIANGSNNISSWLLGMAWWLTTTVISPTASPSMVIVGIFYGATMGFFSLFDGSKRTLHRDVMGYTVSNRMWVAGYIMRIQWAIILDWVP